MSSPPDEAYEPRHMSRAIELAQEAIEAGGGPFGAVIVKDGAVLAEAHNRVVLDRDPTAHAEVRALRLAAEVLDDHVLSGCTIYSSCEPCPMCLGALFWSRIDRVWFAATREDASAAGFDDRALYDELARPLHDRSLPIACRDREAGLAPMRQWISNADKTLY